MNFASFFVAKNDKVTALFSEYFYLYHTISTGCFPKGLSCLFLLACFKLGNTFDNHNPQYSVFLFFLFLLFFLILAKNERAVEIHALLRTRSTRHVKGTCPSSLACVREFYWRVSLSPQLEDYSQTGSQYHIILVKLAKEPAAKFALTKWRASKT